MYTSFDMKMFRDSESGSQSRGMLGLGNVPSSGSPTSSFGFLRNPDHWGLSRSRWQIRGAQYLLVVFFWASFFRTPNLRNRNAGGERIRGHWELCLPDRGSRLHSGQGPGYQARGRTCRGGQQRALSTGRRMCGTPRLEAGCGVPGCSGLGPGAERGGAGAERRRSGAGLSTSPPRRASLAAAAAVAAAVVVAPGAGACPALAAGPGWVSGCVWDRGPRVLGSTRDDVAVPGHDGICTHGTRACCAGGPGGARGTRAGLGAGAMRRDPDLAGDAVGTPSSSETSCSGSGPTRGESIPVCLELWAGALAVFVLLAGLSMRRTCGVPRTG